MGRFASTAEFYLRYREPYSTDFFQAISERLALRGDETLLDIGCGPAQLAIGIAPFVASCTGLDPEPAMIEVARASSKQARVSLALRPGRIEDFSADELFDVVTIGRTLHWLERRIALEVLERIVSKRGRVLVCSAASIETPSTPWLKLYQEICRSRSDDPSRQRYRIKALDWFAGSPFRKLDSVSVRQTHQVSIADLIGRALSKSNTSPAFLGESQAEFEAQIRVALEPFSKDGTFDEEIVGDAEIFGR
jgi:ubiquinone/menaquinone biosynthesis C-methylase UbiE